MTLSQTQLSLSRALSLPAISLTERYQKPSRASIILEDSFTRSASSPLERASSFESAALAGLLSNALPRSPDLLGDLVQLGRGGLPHYLRSQKGHQHPVDRAFTGGRKDENVVMSRDTYATAEYGDNGGMKDLSN